MKEKNSRSPWGFFCDCSICKKSFSWNDCIAAYTADEKNKTICIQCQSRAFAEKENEARNKNT